MILEDALLLVLLAGFGLIGIAVLPWREHQLRQVETAFSALGGLLVSAVLLCVWLTTGKKD